MLKWSLYNYSDPYILVKGTITNAETVAAPNNRKIKVTWVHLLTALTYWLNTLIWKFDII